MYSLHSLCGDGKENGLGFRVLDLGFSGHDGVAKDGNSILG